MADSPRFKVGDVVEYNVDEVPYMEHWAHLNGRLGVVVEADLPSWNGTRGAVVKWITLESYPEDREHSPYPYELLRLVGHIDEEVQRG